MAPKDPGEPREALAFCGGRVNRAFGSHPYNSRP